MTNRPQYNSAAVVDMVVDDLLPDLLHDSKIDIKDLDAVLEYRLSFLTDLSTCLETEPYKMAKHFEVCGWEVDFQFCKILAQIEKLKKKVHELLVAQWVKTNNIKIPYKIDETVRTKQYGLCRIWSVHQSQGTVKVCIENPLNKRLSTYYDTKINVEDVFPVSLDLPNNPVL